MGKVAVIRDAGAITCVWCSLTHPRNSLAHHSFEALLFFLYTNDIRFAPFSSATRYEPARARVGDWSMAKLPSPSAKSIYRLADKVINLAFARLLPLSLFLVRHSSPQRTSYDAHSQQPRRLRHCGGDILQFHLAVSHPPLIRITGRDSFLRCSFPEILSMQVSFLVQKMNEESKGGTEGTTRERLRNKIASLSQSQLKRSTDTLAMIWNYTKEPPKPPTTKPSESAVPVTPSSFPNWLRVQLALLKSMTTGIFIDLQFYAYSKVFNNLPLDPKPLYASSIVIKKLAPAISKGKSDGSSPLSTLTCDQRDDGDKFPSCLSNGRTDR